MSSNSLVQEMSFQTTDELLDALSPRGSFFGQEYEPRRWIFRGHGDAEYPLLPKILRPPRDPERPLYLFCQGVWHPINHLLLSGDTLVIAELDTLLRFFDIADQNGLALPEDSVGQRKKLRELRIRIVRSARHMDEDSDEDMLGWPSEASQSLMALAQHYGVPTRLLDWTYSAHTAAYFAASDAMEIWHKGAETESAGRKDLSVWALQLEFLESHPARKAIELVAVPTASNPNLYAQRGVFTVRRQSVKPDHSDINRVDRRPLEQVIEAEFGEYSFDRPVMWHIKLPRIEAPKLLRLLSKEGFDRARLFPGYSGVAKALLEQSLWDGNGR